MEPDYQTPERMAAKQAAIGPIDWTSKRVLDVGCDMGAWGVLALNGEADHYLGLDRGRDVRGWHTDLVYENQKAFGAKTSRADFKRLDLGKQWHEFGKFDAVLCLSMYHHAFENCGSHDALWFWLWRHLEPGGELIWEGPIDDDDPVVRANMSALNREAYRDAWGNGLNAGFYFDLIAAKRAPYNPTRYVMRVRARARELRTYAGAWVDGANGATAAFNHEDGRRIREVKHVLGVEVLPGSLNVMLDDSYFDWARGYYRAEILDVETRGVPLDRVEWKPRWARFYPLKIGGLDCWAFRFEGETYRLRFVELISPHRLSQAVPADRRVTLCRT